MPFWHACQRRDATSEPAPVRHVRDRLPVLNMRQLNLVALVLPFDRWTPWVFVNSVKMHQN